MEFKIERLETEFKHKEEILEQVAVRLAGELGVVLIPQLSAEEQSLEYWRIGRNKEYLVEYSYDDESDDEVLIVHGERKAYPKMTVVRLSRPQVKLAVVVSILEPQFKEFQEIYHQPPDKSAPFYGIGVEINRQVANPLPIPSLAPKKTYVRCFDAKLPDLGLVTKELIEYYLR